MRDSPMKARAFLVTLELPMLFIMEQQMALVAHDVKLVKGKRRRNMRPREKYLYHLRQLIAAERWLLYGFFF